MPNTRIHHPQRPHESSILAGRDSGNPADPAVSVHSYSQACAGGLGMPRRRIVPFRIKHPRKRVQQRDQAAFAGVILMQMRRNDRGLHRIDHRPPADDISPLPQCPNIPRHPIRRSDRVRVGGQQHAIVTGQFGGKLHRQAPRMTRIGLARRQIPADHLQSKPQMRRQFARDRLGRVSAIVEQHHHPVRAVDLRIQCGEAGADPFGFIPYRDSDNTFSHRCTTPWSGSCQKRERLCAGGSRPTGCDSLSPRCYDACADENATYTGGA